MLFPVLHCLFPAYNSKRCLSPGVFRFALGLPRGHAKTTFIKVLICWFLCYDKAKCILIICADAKLAELLLADIHYIMGSPGIVSVYGDWEQGLSIDSADTKEESVS